MRITLLQTAPEWGNPAQSREDARRMLMGTLKTDLVVLPEMFSTGFVTDPVGVAEEGEGDSLRWMKDYARSKGCAIAGSVSTHVDGTYCNRFYFVFPDGHYQYYDKHHLFTYAGEDKRYTAGNERVVVEHAGFRILLQVCYVAGVNRAGKDPGNLYSGHTSLYGPRGELLSICKEGRIDIIESELKRPVLDQFRQSFPALADADY